MFGATDSTNVVTYSITPSLKILNEDGSPTDSTIAEIFTHGSHVVSAKLSLAKNYGSLCSSI